MKNLQISRRTVLRGLGACMALPLLESMMPLYSVAGSTAAKAASEMPLRMAFIYVPNGLNMQAWTPATTGADFALTPTLAPLQEVKDHITILSGLAQRKAFANGDGPGDHARAQATFLTGCQAKKTGGADIKIGVSVDQVAADAIGKETRFASLEIGCEEIRSSGACDSGYSCAYSNNLSWRTESTPVAKEINPRLVFERLFGIKDKGETDESRFRRERYNKSILDFVNEDAQTLKNRLGANDQRKLEEYLDGVREIELRLTRAQPTVDIGDTKIVRPTGIPHNYEEHIRLMADILALAFKTDLTRVSTFVFANDGSNREYGLIGVPEGHHDTSHHGGDKKKLEKIQKINMFHTTQLAYFLGKLKDTQEGDGNLLDNCMIVYGAGIGDGNRHNHDDLPILLAGKGKGTIKSGRHLRYERNTPLSNLYLSMLDRIDAEADAFGDSTGPLTGLEG
jgi:hypothetical protein